MRIYPFPLLVEWSNAKTAAPQKCDELEERRMLGHDLKNVHWELHEMRPRYYRAQIQNLSL
jgi:hypothetical protein